MLKENDVQIATTGPDEKQTDPNCNQTVGMRALHREHPVDCRLYVLPIGETLPVLDSLNICAAIRQMQDKQ